MMRLDQVQVSGFGSGCDGAKSAASKVSGTALLGRAGEAEGPKISPAMRTPAPSAPLTRPQRNYLLPPAASPVSGRLIASVTVSE